MPADGQAPPGADTPQMSPDLETEATVPLATGSPILEKKDISLPSGAVVLMRQTKLADLETFEDSALARSGMTLLKILSLCTEAVVEPGPYGKMAQGSGKLSWPDMAQQDVHSAAIQLRMLSQGNEYEFDAECQVLMCRQDIPAALDLGTLKMAPMHPDAVASIEKGEPLEFTFPQTGIPCRWHVLRGTDAVKVAMTLRHKRGDAKKLIRRAAMLAQVDEVEGLHHNILHQKLPEFPSRDTEAWNQHRDEMEGGYETDIQQPCEGCGQDSDLVLPVDQAFFSGAAPRWRRSRRFTARPLNSSGDPKEAGSPSN